MFIIFIKLKIENKIITYIKTKLMINNDSYLENIPIETDNIMIKFNHFNVISLTKFKNLKILYCSNSNNLSKLSNLPDGLQELFCNDNKLTELPKLPDSLRLLNCNSNNLTELPKLSNSLIVLRCDNNNLTKLPKLPDSLRLLDCNGNNLTELPKLPECLSTLICGSNTLTKLPELPNKLMELECGNNKLSKLPKLPDDLEILFCDINKLTELPKLPNDLRILNYDNNIICDIIDEINDNETSDDYEISDNRINRINKINKINKKQEILINFNFLYNCLKFKIKFSKWLWQYVREPKIKEICNPLLLSKLLEKDMNEETFENIIDSFGKTTFNSR